MALLEHLLYELRLLLIQVPLHRLLDLLTLSLAFVVVRCARLKAFGLPLVELGHDALHLLTGLPTLHIKQEFVHVYSF